MPPSTCTTVRALPAALQVPLHRPKVGNCGALPVVFLDIMDHRACHALRVATERATMGLRARERAHAKRDSVGCRATRARLATSGRHARVRVWFWIFVVDRVVFGGRTGQ